MNIKASFVRRVLLRQAALAMLAASATHLAIAQNGSEHWVTTWTTAHRQAPPATAFTVGQSTTAAQQAQLGFKNQTVRMIVPVSIGGNRVRIHLSNAFGATPLVVGAAHAALRAKESAIIPGSDRVLHFSGNPGITVPPGAVAISDPVDLEIPPLGELAVSLFVPETTGAPTIHGLASHTTYVSKAGDFAGQPSIADPVTTQSWYWLASVDIAAPADAATIVAFGDSITDGARATPNTDSSWPSRLARRLAANPARAHLAVVNQGIGGNRILRDGTGPNALARFDVDVLSYPGVKWLILLEGINDIGRGLEANADPKEAVTADELIAAARQMIERAHLHGIKVMGATLTPYMAAPRYSEKGENVREAFNTWISSGGAFDAVVDFEAAARDPQNSRKLRPEFDSGDHLHPSDAGYKAMADAIDLTVFSPRAISAAASR